MQLQSVQFTLLVDGLSSTLAIGDVGDVGAFVSADGEPISSLLVWLLSMRDEGHCVFGRLS